MTEDLTFHQLERDGSAVDGDERLVAARTFPVDGLGTQFLAGTALTSDETGRLAWSSCLDDAIHRLHR